MKGAQASAIANSKRLLPIFSIFSAVLILLCTALPAAADTYPLPEGQQFFPYYCAADQPVLGNGTDVNQIVPLGVGPVATGGGAVDIFAGIPPMAGNVDVYFALYAPALSPDVYIMDSQGNLSPLTDLVPWLQNVPFAWQSIFGDIPAGALPPAAYYLYLIVTPAGQTPVLTSADNYYFWQTSFLVTPPYFSISKSCVNFGQASSGTTQKVTITNPGDDAQDMLMIDGITSVTDDYQITADTCSGQPALAAGQSCDFSVVFAPVSAGNVSAGSISVMLTRVSASGGISSASLPETLQLPIMVTGQQQTCSQPQLSATSKQYGAGGGPDSVSVTAGTGCSWTAQSDSSWITISTGSSGSGNGTISYTVSANSGTTQRTGHITVGSVSLTITQDGVSSACSPVVGPAQPASFGSVGGTGTVQVTAAADCTWSASVSLFYSSWLTITSGKQYTGSKTVQFSVAGGSTAVNGFLNVAGQTVSVSRSASGTSCSYSISANGSTTFGSSGGSGSFTVSTGSNCPWTIKSTQSWPTSFSPASGYGYGTVNYTVPPSEVSGNATIYVSEAPGTQLIVSQTSGGTSPSCSYSVGALPQSFGSGGGSGTFTVTASGDGCSTWTLSSDSPWITFPSGSSGSGSGSVNFSVSANTLTSQRTGTISLDSSHSVSISQAGTQSGSCNYSLSSSDTQPIAYTTGTGDGTFTGTISVSTGSGCTWSAVKSAGWITITSGSSGSGSGTVTYTVPANTGAARAGTISIGGQTYVVVQAAVPEPVPPCTAYIAPPTSQSFGSSGGNGTISFVTTGCGTWSVTPSDGWINITSGRSGSGDGSFTASYSVSSNTQIGSRSGSITIGDTSIPQPLSITQAGASQISYTAFTVNSSNNFYSLPAGYDPGTAAEYFSFTVPSGGCPLTGEIQVWLAGLVPYAGNNNMLLTDSDFGTEDNALSLYEHFFQYGAVYNTMNAYGSAVEYPSASGQHYWYGFTTSGESENLDLFRPVANKTYYLAVVNDGTGYTSWRLEVKCY